MKYFKEKQSTHKNVEQLYCKALETQEYITSKHVNKKDAVTLVAYGLRQ